ncbi:MAG: DegV family protein [Dehalococcoidia bacterium]|nr:DegV family protein [Dehalococcoidia bacterium]
MTVRVVTDSTSDLPPDVAARLGITVVPLNVHFGTEMLKDGVDILPDAFYKRLVSGTVLPKTSQPSVGEFLQVYDKVGKGAEAIVSILVSSKLSGTYNSAVQAVPEYKGACKIEVIDTLQASMGLGLIATAAARVAQAGGSAQQVAEEARRAMGKVDYFGVVDTLEYLEKGGRIGKAQAFLGGILKVKPVLMVKDGIAHPVERARTLQKAMDKVMEMARLSAPLAEAGVLYATTPDVAQALAERLKPLTNDGQVLMGRIGPVVGTYLGPGALAVGIRRA